MSKGKNKSEPVRPVQTKPEKTPNASPLGKQAKYGVSVILALLLVLVVVSVMRWTRGSDEGESTALAGNADARPSESAAGIPADGSGEARLGAPLKTDAAGLPGFGSATQATIVPAAPHTPASNSPGDPVLPPWASNAASTETRESGSNGSSDRPTAPSLTITSDPFLVGGNPQTDRAADSARDSSKNPENPPAGDAELKSTAIAEPKPESSSPPVEPNPWRDFTVSTAAPTMPTAPAFADVSAPAEGHGNNPPPAAAEPAPSNRIWQPDRPGRTYTVVAGDTLFNIARHELGRASRWTEIYELNRDKLGRDFNSLKPGMKLALPERKTTLR